MNEWMNECLESHENESCKARAREENNRNEEIIHFTQFYISVMDRQTNRQTWIFMDVRLIHTTD